MARQRVTHSSADVIQSLTDGRNIAPEDRADIIALSEPLIGMGKAALRELGIWMFGFGASSLISDQVIRDATNRIDHFELTGKALSNAVTPGGACTFGHVQQMFGCSSCQLVAHRKSHNFA